MRRKGDKNRLTSVELSKRERELLQLLCNGLSHKEISKKLSISPHTVKCHVSNIISIIRILPDFNDFNPEKVSQTNIVLYAIAKLGFKNGYAIDTKK